MCTDCGCALSKEHHIELSHSLLAENRLQAEKNRKFFHTHRLTVINIMSAPGSGKTELLRNLIPQLAPLHCGVIVGDLQTDNDAKRIRTTLAPVIQITTGHACHLNAHMISAAIKQLPLTELDVVFIENVGNLVCPADYDLGQNFNIVLISVTEGDDKPCKYPTIFRCADLVAISKIDLLPYMKDFDVTRLGVNLQNIGIQQVPMTISVEGMLDPIASWIREHHEGTLAAGTSKPPH